MRSYQTENDFLYKIGQTLYIREFNTKVRVIDLDNAGLSRTNNPNYHVIDDLAKKKYYMKQHELTAIPKIEFEDCPFRVGDIVYARSSTKSVFSVTITQIQLNEEWNENTKTNREKYIIICDNGDSNDFEFHIHHLSFRKDKHLNKISRPKHL